MEEKKNERLKEREIERIKIDKKKKKKEKKKEWKKENEAGDPPRTMQEIKIWSFWEMRHAQNRITVRKWDT